MGQYYIAVILGSEGEPREFIRCWVDSHSYGGGAKLMEHSYIGNGFTNSIDRLLSPLGPFWKSRLVWAGDYADPEPGYGGDMNLYGVTAEDEEGKEQTPSGEALPPQYCFYVNHTKKQFVNKAKILEKGSSYRIYPLSLLTAEGNGRGGGDYHGAREDLVGSWARDVISVEKEVPTGFTELECGFDE
jgi:hypothetical protein